jgi:hypothetical protein
MRIVVDNRGFKFIDQQLFDHINNIWITYDCVIKDDSNIFFAKNTTVNRLITDYCEKGFQRVIKKEKADYVIITRFLLNSFPQYFDGANITSDDTKEVVYPINNMSVENINTIEMVADFQSRSQNVIYVNQDKLNESLNNGFVITKDNYNTLSELINSGSDDNYALAVKMLVNSDLKMNWEWILYLFSSNYSKMSSSDDKGVIHNYITSLNLGYNKTDLYSKKSVFFKVVKNQDVIDMMKNKCRQIVASKIQSKINSILGEESNLFKVNDFNIDLA